MKDLFLSKIDFSASRLRPYEGFIFLCGGRTDVTSPHPASIRDAIYRELAKDTRIERRIRVAEHYKDWSHDSIYRDLVSFEKHLAELSSVIVLVLESPGSIAELGLFSVVDEFKSKLLIFVETEHYKSDSFIRLGPIDYLEKAYQNTAECHDWLTTTTPRVFDPAAATALQPELADAVRGRANRPLTERQFQPGAWLDCGLLICDLLNIFSALTLRELKGLLEPISKLPEQNA